MARAPSHAILAEKSKLFKRFFETEDGRAILAEIKDFCFAGETTIAISKVMGQVDPYLSMRNEGRRQVLLMISKLAEISLADIDRLISINEREAIRDAEYELVNN